MNVKDFWRQVLAQRAETIRPYFCPDAVIQWPCTNECFTLEEYLQANCDYPGQWKGEVEHVYEGNDAILTLTRVFAKDGSMSCHVTSLFEISGGKIVFLKEYWADDGPPPPWRQAMRLGRPIR